MSAKGRHRPWWRRVLRLGGWLIVALLGLLVAGRLWLAGPWARDWLAGRLEARIGLPVSIDSLAWWPASGVVLGGVEVGQPEALRDALGEPLLRVERLRVWPRYRSLLSPADRVAGIELDQPRLVIAVEMLATLGAGAMESAPAVETIPAVALNDADLEAGVGREAPDDPSPVATPAPDGAGGSDPDGAGGLDPAGAGDPGPDRPPGEATIASAAERTHWATLRGGSMTLVGLGVRWGALEGIEADLPWGPGTATGRVEIDALELGREGRAGALSGVIRNGPAGLEMTIQENSGKLLQLTGNLTLANKRGLPFRVRLGVRRERPVELLRPDGNGVRCEGFAVQGAMMGWLTAPASWQGAAGGTVERPAMAWGPLRAEFADGEVQLQLAGGRLGVPSARLSSAQHSLLGNGRLDREGGAAVLRLVVPPEHVGAIRNWVAERTGGARIRFESFDPPDRRYADLEAVSSPEGWQVELGAGGTVLPLGVLFEALGGLQPEGLRGASSPAISGE